MLLLQVTSKPGRKNLSNIAYMAYTAYPDSFRDEVEGDIIGTGYDLLAHQLFNK